MKYLLTLLLSLPVLCFARSGVNMPAKTDGVRQMAAGRAGMGEGSVQRLQLLECTEDELIEGYPEEILDYSVRLRNPNDITIAARVSLKLYDASDKYIGEPAGAYKTIALAAGEEQAVDLKLVMPPGGEERRVRICVTTDDDEYSFGYFDIRSQTVTEGTPQLSVESVEPAGIRFTTGRNVKAKVKIKNTGGFFSNKVPGCGTLKYEIYAKKITIEGKGTFSNLPIYDEADFAQPVRIDKDETATAEIELGTEAFANLRLGSYVGTIAPGFVLQPGEYYILISYSGSERVYFDPIPFVYDGDEPNKLYLPETPVKARTGTQVTLPVSMENPVGITNFQFDIYLPEGVTCATDGRGRPMVSLGDRTDIYSHSIAAAMQQSGALRVVCYSVTNLLFDGNDGNVANITLDIAADAPLGVQQIRVDSIALADPAGNAYLPAGFTASLDVYDFISGDANNDQTVNVADIPATASFILGNAEDGYCREAADINGDGVVRVDDLSLLAGIIMQSPSKAAGTCRVAAQAPDKVFPDKTQHSEGSGEVIPFAIEPAQSATVTFDLDVPEAELCGVQFDIYLPEGITVDKTPRGVYKFGHVEDRIDSYTHVISSADRAEYDADENIIPGTEHIRVVCYSNTNEIFLDRKGALISIPLTASGDLASGVYEVRLKNIIATTVKAVAWGVPDNSLSVLSGDLSQAGSLPDLQGHWTDGAAGMLSAKLADNSTIPYVSLVQATDIAPTAAIRTANPNTLVYVPGDMTMAGAANIVSGADCVKLQLADGYPFHAPAPFTAAEATYTRQLAADGWYSLCLPFAADIPDGLNVERFESLDEARSTVTFTTATSVSADTPCIFHAATGGIVTFSASGAAIAATPDRLTDGALTATYRSTAVGEIAGKYALRNDGTGFGICDATAYVPPFRAYLDGGTSLPTQAYALSHGNASTGIGHAAACGLDVRPGRAHVVLESGADLTVDIVSLAGQTVRTVRLRPGRPQTVTLPAGIYLAGGGKFIVR